MEVARACSDVLSVNSFRSPDTYHVLLITFALLSAFLAVDATERRPSARVQIEQCG